MKKLANPGLDAVRLTDEFWKKRTDQMAAEVIPYQWRALNDDIPGAEPSHAVENFRIACGDKQGVFYGKVFQDSDLAKWIEAAAFSLSTHPDKKIEGIVDEAVDLIARTQTGDGYVNTYFTVAEPGKRFTNLQVKHELYCAGHLIEAAVAYFQATGKRRFLDVMIRYAELIERSFGSGPGKIRGYDGHEEIELALVKLYRVTGNDRQLALARFFVEERGRQPHFFDREKKDRSAEATAAFHREMDYSYYQAHKPIREQVEVDGHAVRAMYFFCGAADLAYETGDQSLTDALKKLWLNMTGKRMYITGGIGSQRFGEAFTFDHDLPNDAAYTETCAAIGLVFWAQRMLRIDPDVRYADAMERALYNGVLSGISLDGRRYFYVNPLEVWPEAAKHRRDLEHVKPERVAWYGCACCPPNVARLVASIGQYLYGIGENEIYVHLFADSATDIKLKGCSVGLTQKTNYPWDGKIQISVSPSIPASFGLNVRLPGWCPAPKVRFGGETVDLAKSVKKGYLRLKRKWNKGDLVEIDLPMEVRQTEAHPRVRENAGKIALERGPLVYCLEQVDNGPNLGALLVPADAAFRVVKSDILGGLPLIKGKVLRRDESDWGNELYRPRRPRHKKVEIAAVPYSYWGNRKPGEMTVWINALPPLYTPDQRHSGG